MNFLTYCAIAQIINMTDNWTERDQKSFEFAKKRCEVFYPRSPCMKKFIKKADLTYNIVCGGVNETKNGRRK